MIKNVSFLKKFLIKRIATDRDCCATDGVRDGVRLTFLTFLKSLFTFVTVEPMGEVVGSPIEALNAGPQPFGKYVVIPSFV